MFRIEETKLLRNIGSKIHTALDLGKGLMSTDSIESVAAEYDRLDQAAKDFGSELSAPFMTLSFMALLVIPEIKLSDCGLFDGKSFRLILLFCD